MNTLAELPSLVLALLIALNPHALVAACVENSNDAVVRVYRCNEGPPAYTFMVIDNAGAPILLFCIGGPAFLVITADNTPTSVGFPTGWEG